MYSVSEVCTLAGVKPHTLRYWERTIPLLSPRKDHYGRRTYTSADVDLIARIKHLTEERGLTLHGAREQLWEERGAARQDVRSRIAEIRRDLLRARAVIRSRRKEEQQ